MAAASYDEMRATNTFDSGLSGAMPRLLRSAVLYGANASGKTSLVQALLFMQRLVLTSHMCQAGDALEVTPFRLTSVSREGDSEFEITFVEQGVRYEYGLCCNSSRVTEEWMQAYPQGRAQKWFHRVFDPETGKDVYRFGSKFGGGRKRQDWANETLENTLFFSKAIQNRNEQLRPAFDWFSKRLRVFLSSPGEEYTVKRYGEAGERKRIIDFMNSADLDVVDIRLEKSRGKVAVANDLSPNVVRQISSPYYVDDFAPKFVHASMETNELVEFDANDESNGTRALFAFSGYWLDMIGNDRVLVMDELDASLHPMVVHHLVKLLHCGSSKAQLIFTAHDTSLLGQKILRRDQIWFVERNKNASKIYSLSDFGPRENEALERGYLNGRYGGIPFLRDLDFYGNR
jgi:AAA15 family ATPase/GTPase